MRSLAEHLIGSGWQVTGSDQSAHGHNAAVLRSLGIRVDSGHSAAHVSNQALVVYSPAVPVSNPERIAARERGIPELSYPQMLGRLMAARTGIAIAGTHGKTTTTALLGWILQQAGAAPSVVCGGELLNTGSGGWAGRDSALVAEACEYRQSFLQLTQRNAALLNIELDHFDCYPDLGAAVEAYRKFAALVPEDGLLVCATDQQPVGEAVAHSGARIETFGIETDADWAARDLQTRPGCTRFRVEREHRHWFTATLHVPGTHLVRNALPAIALAAELGLDPDAIRHGLASFRGVRRRFERLGNWRGLDLIDDYAHHPTAVAATIQAARTEFPGRRLLAVFQPHQISRTRMLLAEFAASLALADDVWIPPVYTARESLGDSIATSEALAAATSGCGRRARRIGSLDRLVSTLETDARPGDVVLLIGAGDIELVRDELSRRIPRHYAS